VAGIQSRGDLCLESLRSAHAPPRTTHSAILHAAAGGKQASRERAVRSGHRGPPLELLEELAEVAAVARSMPATAPKIRHMTRGSRASAPLRKILTTTNIKMRLDHHLLVQKNLTQPIGLGG
jgi:hypothetical protein